MFALRFSLDAIDNLLITDTFLLFARRLLLGPCLTLVGPVLSRCSLLTVYRTFAHCLLHANRYDVLAAHDSLFAFCCFQPVADKSSCPPRS